LEGNREVPGMNNEKRLGQADEGIALSELIESIWKSKILIIALIIVGAILAGLLSFFVQKPVYESRFGFIVNMPKLYMTRYGQYEMPGLTNEQYANLIKNSYVLTNTAEDLKSDYDLLSADIRDMIRVSAQGNDKMSYAVSVSAGDPELSHKVAQVLYDNYIKYVNVVVKEAALNYFADFFRVGLESSAINLELEKGILKSNEELLANTPKFINMEELQDSLPGTGNYYIAENVLSPAYMKLETDIVTRRQNIYTLENTINVYKANLNAINKEKEAVAEYYESGEAAPVESSIINVVQRGVMLTSAPSQGDRSGSGHVKNIMLGVVIGGVLGFAAVLVKGLFKNE